MTTSAQQTSNSIPFWGKDEVAALLRMAPNLGSAYHQIRERALVELGRAVPPTKRGEVWRFTHPDLFPLDSLRNSRPSEVELSFSGKRSASSLPKGVSWLSFEDALKTHGARISELLFRGNPTELAATTNAQLATVSGGGVLVVSAGVEMLEPVILHTPALEGSTTAPLIVVIVERGACARVLWQSDQGGDGAFLAPRFEAVVERDARIHLGLLETLDVRTKFLSRERVSLHANASAFITQALLGGRVARSDLDLFLLEMGAHAEVRAGFAPDGRQHIDLHPTQYHLAPHCTSNVMARGVLRGKSRGVYYGYIRVAEGAQKTDAYQSNRNLLLSPEAQVDAIPNLEIIANDVRCSHGASISRVGAEELFYLQSRGLPQDVAERMIVQGFFADLWSPVEDGVIRDTVARAVDSSIGVDRHDA